jgi:hypothetical protein
VPRDIALWQLALSLGACALGFLILPVIQELFQLQLPGVLSPQRLFIAKTLGTVMVHIFVGPSKTRYRVHKAFLCAKADYFSKIFNSGFKETIYKAVTLLEVDPAVLNLFLEWIYGSNFQPSDMKTSTPTSGPTKFYGVVESICLRRLQYCATAFNSLCSQHRRIQPECARSGPHP